MRLLQIITITLTCLLCSGLYAQRHIGSDIRYRQLSAAVFEIEHIAYRDCRSIALNAMPLKVYNDSFELTLNPVRVKIEELKQAACTALCAPQNTAAGMGVEAHYFKDTIDFSGGVFALFGSKNHPRVYFGVENCCRNSYLFTGSTDFFTEAMLDLYHVRQSSENISFNAFHNPPQTYVLCNQTHSYSFKVPESSYADSLVYVLDKPKYSHSGVYNYSVYNIPLTPYCPPNPGVRNCTPNTALNPARGSHFDPRNGNFIVTPTKCDELSVLVCRVDLYRPSGDSVRLLGYIKRDMQLVVLNSNLYGNPYLAQPRDYPVKARETFCAEMAIKDDLAPAQSRKDSLSLDILEWPKFGKLSLKDSFSREKTLRFCWNPSDSDYIQKHVASVSFRVKENQCNPYQVFGLSTTFRFPVVAPDSLSAIQVKTYLDINGNKRRDAGEPYRPAAFFSMRNKDYTGQQTGSDGSLAFNAIHGLYRFGIAESAEMPSSGKDTVLFCRFDSSHTIELGFRIRSGFRGRVFDDANSNCAFDSGESLIRNYRLLLKGKNRAVLSNANGVFRVFEAPGRYALESDSNSAWIAVCGMPDSIDVFADSVIVLQDIPMRRKNRFADLYPMLEPQPHIADNRFITQRLRLSNEGFTVEKNVQFKLLCSRRLSKAGSTRTMYKNGDTLVWLIDSIRPGEVVYLDLKQELAKDSFAPGEQLCYTLFCPADSARGNDVFRLCETVYSADPGFKAKTSHQAKPLTAPNKSMVYTLAYKHDSALLRHLFLKDTLDESIFDLRTFCVLQNPGNFTLHLAGNVLMAECSGSIPAQSVKAFTYALQLLKAPERIFEIRNCVRIEANGLMDPLPHCVTESTASPLKVTWISDTLLCPGAMLNLALVSLAKPAYNNRFLVYLSDINGNFTNAVLLTDTANKSQMTTLRLKLPDTLAAGKGYILRVSGTAPAVTAFETAVPYVLEVLPKPVPVLQTNLFKGGICRGDTLKARGRGGVQFRFFYGNYPAGGFSADTLFQVLPQGASVLALEVMDANQCTARTDNTSFNVFEAPVLRFAADPPEVCAGGISRLEMQGATWRLYLDSIFLLSGSGSGNYLSDTLFKSSVFRLLGTDTNHCRAEAVAQVTVHALPFKPVVYQFGKSIYSNYSNGNQWYDASGKIDSAVNQYFYPPVNGTYRVVYTNSKQCSSMSDAYQFRYYGLQSGAAGHTVVLYPSPADNLLQFRFEPAPAITEAMGYALLDLNGRMLLEGKLDEAARGIDVSSLSGGLYLFRLRGGDLAYSRMVCIVHD